MSTTDREAGGAPGVGTPGEDPDRSSQAVRVRPMTRADLAAVLTIERSSFGVPWTRSTFRSLMERRGAALWVAESGDGIAGYAVVWTVLDQAELGNVAVAAGWRRRGVASRLVETVVAWLSERGVREVFLEVRESNHGARALYARHGFEPVGRRRGYYSRPQEDALVLRRSV